jgi:hypothetical protein
MNCGYLGAGKASKCGTQRDSRWNERNSFKGRSERYCVNILWDTAVNPKHICMDFIYKSLRYKPEGRGIDSRWCQNFSLTQSFRPHYGPGVDSASNRNEYQECFLGVKAVGAQGWQPCHLHVPIVMKSGSLILLEPSGPVKACNGTALPSYINKCLGACIFISVRATCPPHYIVVEFIWWKL